MASTNHCGDLSVGQSVIETDEFALKRAELECEERLRREDVERPYGGFVRERVVKLPTLAEMDELRKRSPKKLSSLQKILAEKRAAAPKFSDEEETPRAHNVPDMGCGLTPSAEAGGVKDSVVVQYERDVAARKAVEDAL